MSWLLGRNRQQPQPEQSGGFADGGGGADPEGRTAGEKSGDAQLSRAERKAMALAMLKYRVWSSTKMVFWLRSNMVGSPGQLKSHENQTNAKS